MSTFTVESTKKSPPLQALPKAVGIQQLHHYAYRAKDAEETRHFYEDILGLPLYHIIQSDHVPSTGEYCPYTHFFFRLLDGSFIAFDDETLEQVWKINVGTGFNAPPMTFEAGGKQYVAILSGLSPIARGKNVNSPELKEQRNQTMLWVFGL